MTSNNTSDKKHCILGHNLVRKMIGFFSRMIMVIANKKIRGITSQGDNHDKIILNSSWILYNWGPIINCK